jgi:hypothetical protein
MTNETRLKNSSIAVVITTFPKVIWWDIHGKSKWLTTEIMKKIIFCGVNTLIISQCSPTTNSI